MLAYARQRQQRLDAVAAIAHGDVAIGIPYRCDFLLTVAALDGFVPIWSNQILHEVERNVLEDNPSINPVKFRTHTLASMLQVSQTLP